MLPDCTTRPYHTISELDDIGSASGYHNVPGRELPVGNLADYRSDDAQLLNMLEQVITAGLLAELDLIDDPEQ